jgi:hypothetical protein
VVICGRKEKLNIMIDYLILNWIDLGILLVLIFIFINTARDAHIINETLNTIDGTLEGIKKKIE